MTATPATSVDIKNHPRFSILRFPSFVDAATVEQARPLIAAQLPEDCACIVVDLSSADFLDSHGIGLFVSLLKRVHAHSGRLVFAGAINQPASVLRMVGFTGALVTYCASVAEAEKLFR